MTAAPRFPAPHLCVVVPTLEEEDALPRLLSDLAGLSIAHEVVVADGGSSDRTVEIAAAAGAEVIAAPRGRGSQIRAGVAASRAPLILLLHADSRLPRDAVRALEDWLAGAGPRDAAYFRFALEGPGRFWRFLELGQRLRERLTGLAYGDQGLVLSRAAWDAVGGAPDVPLMEDVILLDRLRHHGSVRRLPAELPTSPRRYEEEGRWRGWLRNTLLICLYRLGVEPGRLASLYPDTAGRTRSTQGGTRGGEPVASVPTTDATVVVFVRAPRPGQVKTRLAAEVGDGAATRLYRALGRRAVDRLRQGPWRLVVAFTPPDAAGEVRPWLGGGPDYRPQRGADLGRRMENALGAALTTSGRACVVGSDVPGLDAVSVEEALAALDDHDLVVGPAEDGGYYLLGLRSVPEELFHDIPWGTARVLQETLGRARALGLSVHLLPPLRDVDTADDVPPSLRHLLEAPQAP